MERGNLIDGSIQVRLTRVCSKRTPHVGHRDRSIQRTFGYFEEHVQSLVS
jgi:hypothetical protein